MLKLKATFIAASVLLGVAAIPQAQATIYVTETASQSFGYGGGLPSPSQEVDVACPAGYTVTGGGYQFPSGVTVAALAYLAPGNQIGHIMVSGFVVVQNGPNLTNDGWVVRGVSDSVLTVQAYAICASPT